jgi:hypothetical protein
MKIHTMVWEPLRKASRPHLSDTVQSKNAVNFHAVPPALLLMIAPKKGAYTNDPMTSNTARPCSTILAPPTVRSQVVRLSEQFFRVDK